MLVAVVVCIVLPYPARPPSMLPLPLPLQCFSFAKETRVATPSTLYCSWRRTHCLRVAQRPESIVVLLPRRIPQPQINRLPIDHYIGAERPNTRIKYNAQGRGQNITPYQPTSQAGQAGKADKQADRHGQAGKESKRQLIGLSDFGTYILLCIYAHV